MAPKKKARRVIQMRFPVADADLLDRMVEQSGTDRTKFCQDIVRAEAVRRGLAIQLNAPVAPTATTVSTQDGIMREGIDYDLDESRTMIIFRPKGD